MTLLPPIYGGAFGAFGMSAYNDVIGAVVPTPNADKAVKPGKPLDRQHLMWGRGTGIGVYQGYAKAPPGTWATYQLQSRHPTIALVYQVVTAPIISGTRHVKILGKDGQYQARKKAPLTGDGVIESEEDMKAELLEASFRPHWSYLVAAACQSLHYGHVPVETIWGRKNDATIPERFKAFRPWQVSMLRDKFDDFAGIRVGSHDLSPQYAVNFVNQPHIDPLFGFSRNENCREEWWEKIQAKIQGMKLDQKATGIIPIVKGPVGDQVNKDGKTVTALSVSQTIAEALARGEPVFMPQYLFDMDSDTARSNPDAAKFTAFDIDFFDAGDTGTHASAILEKLHYIDSELFMAWGRPAQEAMETQMGTKAQAGSHRTVGILDSELVHGQIIGQVNESVVRTFNVANWGPEEAMSYVFDPAPIEDTSAELRDALIQKLMSGPEGTTHLDVRRMLKDAELPMVPEEEAAAKLAEADQQQKAEQAAQLDVMKSKGGGAKGDGNGQMHDRLGDLVGQMDGEN